MSIHFSRDKKRGKMRRHANLRLLKSCRWLYQHISTFLKGSDFRLIKIYFSIPAVLVFKNSTWKILMEKVPAHCCEDVAEDDASGLLAGSLCSLPELCLPGHRCGVCAHSTLERTCTRTRSPEVLLSISFCQWADNLLPLHLCALWPAGKGH